VLPLVTAGRRSQRMSPVPYTIVDTEASLSAVLRSFNVSSVSARPVLYLDLEGINLCRHGSIAIMQVYQSEETMYIW